MGGKVKRRRHSVLWAVLLGSLAAQEQPLFWKKQAPAETSTSSSRLFQPGDEVSIIVGKTSRDFRISPDGTLQVPGRSFQAAGKTREELEREMSEWAGLPVSVSLKWAIEQRATQTQPPRGSVIVSGHADAIRPGAYAAGPIRDVLARAGGISGKGSSKANVWRDGKKIEVQNASRSDFLLLPGDVVEVPLSGGESFVSWRGWRFFRNLAIVTGIAYATIRITR